MQESEEERMQESIGRKEHRKEMGEGLTKERKGRYHNAQHDTYKEMRWNVRKVLRASYRTVSKWMPC